MVYLALEQTALTLMAAIVCIKERRVPEAVVFVYGLASLCNAVAWRRLIEQEPPHD